MATRYSPRNHASSMARRRSARHVQVPVPVTPRMNRAGKRQAPPAPRKAPRASGVTLTPSSPMSMLLTAAAVKRQALQSLPPPQCAALVSATVLRASPEPEEEEKKYCVLVCEDDEPQTIIVLDDDESSDDDDVIEIEHDNTIVIDDDDEPDVDCACMSGPCLVAQPAPRTTALPVLTMQNIQFLIDLHREREQHFTLTNSSSDVLKEKLILRQLMTYVLREGVVKV